MTDWGPPVRIQRLDTGEYVNAQYVPPPQIMPYVGAPMHEAAPFRYSTPIVRQRAANSIVVMWAIVSLFGTLIVVFGSVKILEWIASW